MAGEILTISLAFAAKVPNFTRVFALDGSSKKETLSVDVHHDDIVSYPNSRVRFFRVPGRVCMQ